MRLQPPATSWQAKAFPFLVLLGWLLILLSFIIGVFVLAPNAVDYLAGNAKATRDGAEAGSVLLNQLALLKATPRWLIPLTFVGVASFMVGIAMAFSTIPAILQNRGQVMKQVFPLIAKLSQ